MNLNLLKGENKDTLYLTLILQVDNYFVVRTSLPGKEMLPVQ